MQSVFEAIFEVEKSGGSGAVCTVIHSSGSTPRHVGSKMLVYPDGKFLGTIGGGEMEGRVIQAAIEAIADSKARRLEYKFVNPEEGDVGVCGGLMEVFIEPIIPTPLILVVGGGHVGRAVVHLAHWLGFRVAVSDDRVEFCTPDMNPGADEFFPGPMAEITKKLTIHSQTYIVLTTRGSNIDIEGLPYLLNSPAAFIGVIGSKRRWTIAKNEMLKMGVSAEKLGLVHSPLGLELNAETPEEIAVSIMAEIIMTRNNGTGKSMKL